MTINNMLNKLYKIVILGIFFTLLGVFSGCGGASNSNQSLAKEQNHTDENFTPAKVDEKVIGKFGDDNTEEKIQNGDMKALVGNWFGENKKAHMNIKLQIRKDGTYKYYSNIKIGKFYNYSRIIRYEGKCHLDKGNSQLILELPDVEAPLILTNKFPNIESPSGVILSPGSTIDTNYQMKIDQSQNRVTATFTEKAKEYLNQKVADYTVPYFTMVASKTNSEELWGDIKPQGYNYGRKLGLETPEWKYALNRMKDDPTNYIMVINDESWQTMFGNRKGYESVIQDPTKMYRWFKYFKDEMKILGKVEGTIIYIIAGDAPAYWVGDIRKDYNNDSKQVTGKIIESRFPEVLERNPSNSFAGIFQMMDYLRMKYAPNVKLGYTIKTWGIGINPFYEPSEGWDNNQRVKELADYFNNYNVQFDILAFNFNPRSKGSTTQEYKAGVKFFSEISKKLQTRDKTQAKVWIWKTSLWNKEHTTFYFQNIKYLVDECNVIGMTLGHGNDLVKGGGFKDNTKDNIYIKSWMIEYFNNQTLDIPVHGTQGLVYWK